MYLYGNCRTTSWIPLKYFISIASDRVIESPQATDGEYTVVRIAVTRQGQSVVVSVKETMLSNRVRLMLEESSADSGDVTLHQEVAVGSRDSGETLVILNLNLKYLQLERRLLSPDLERCKVACSW